MDTGCGLHSEEFDALKIMEQIKELTKKITDTFCNAELTDLLDDMLISAMEEYSAKVAAEDEKKNKSESE